MRFRIVISQGQSLEIEYQSFPITKKKTKTLSKFNNSYSNTNKAMQPDTADE